MKLPLYQVDAFTEELFKGNPAAVVSLESWLPDELMQNIAAENNLSETAFFVPNADGFHIRWFTPTVEVKLCGHATLAAAHVIFHCLDFEQDKIIFDSLSGKLSVVKNKNRLTLDFPAQFPQPCPIPNGLVEALGLAPKECFSTEDLLAVFENEYQIVTMKPNFMKLQQLEFRGVIVTAAATETGGVDFVSRFLAPRVGINEDPVTGAAHTKLTPLWAEKLGKTKLKAKQLSARGGELACELQNDRVLISGTAKLYLQGEIILD